MDWPEIKRLRKQAIDGMKDVLEHTEPLGLNVVFVFCLGTPVIAWQCLKAAMTLISAGVLGMIAMMFKIAITPVIALYLLIDTTLISLWYLKEIAKKISEEPK